ncbi:M48 family metalloprotease [Parvularcula sp. ZS-1/3]|uniref:M48 family metalloprotease n=1 Tax=Parvularcula mediterranea TaxID=2732508 RepID=A0A7Y3RJ61_9PROT|nr:M48 family metalloprotease [Parvularcula mediterranea]NNU15033.1 M48 family metalloprotease [Parvularcula mediterranea]
MLNWRRSLTALAAVASFAAQASAQVLLRDAEIEEWLYEMSEPLFDAAQLPKGGVEILLIGDPTPNAFAGSSSGLKMGIHTGLITLAETPNEVEGVIAHEAGHLAGGHSARTRDAIAKASRPQMLGLLLGAALIAAGAPPEAGFGAIGLGQQAALDTYLTYSRGQESAADQAAVGYLDEVGSSTKGLLDFFDNLRNMQLIRANAPNPYFQTHPLAVQRVARLRERAEASPYYGNGNTEAEIKELRMIQAKINGFLMDPNAALRVYPLTDQSDAARYARAVAYFRSSDLDGATREIERLLTAHPENPYFHELQGQMLFEHGKPAEAIAPHRRAIALGPDSALLEVNLARALIATDRDHHINEASAVLRSALQKERNNSFAWSLLARAESHNGREEYAMLAQAEAAYHGYNPVSAHRFATLARERLKAGTPEYQQALDIIVATAEEAQNARRQIRRR